MKENDVSAAVIGAAIEVHRVIGAGLIEAPYEESMCHEMHLRGLSFRRQQAVPIRYKGITLATPLRLDLLVEDKVIVELKAKEFVTDFDKVKLLTYLRLTNLRLGLILNFHVVRLKDGISRVVNDLVEAEDPPPPPDLHA